MKNVFREGGKIHFELDDNTDCCLYLSDGILHIFKRTATDIQEIREILKYYEVVKEETEK